MEEAVVKVKNVSGVDRLVSGRLVLAGGVLEVPADEVESYTCQPDNWQPVNTKKKED